MWLRLCMVLVLLYKVCIYTLALGLLVIALLRCIIQHKLLSPSVQQLVMLLQGNGSEVCGAYRQDSSGETVYLTPNGNKVKTIWSCFTVNSCLYKSTLPHLCYIKRASPKLTVCLDTTLTLEASLYP